MDAVKQNTIVPRSGKNGGKEWPSWKDKRVTPPNPITGRTYPTVTNSPGSALMANNRLTPTKRSVLPGSNQSVKPGYVGFPPSNVRNDVSVGNRTVVWTRFIPPKHTRTATDNAYKAFKPKNIAPQKGSK